MTFIKHLSMAIFMLALVQIPVALAQKNCEKELSFSQRLAIARNAELSREVTVDFTQANNVDWLPLVGQTVRVKFGVEDKSTLVATAMAQVFGNAALKGQLDLHIQKSEDVFSLFTVPNFVAADFYSKGIEASKSNHEAALVGIRDLSGNDGWQFSNVILGDRPGHVSLKETGRALDQLLTKFKKTNLRNIDLIVLHTHPVLEPFNLVDKEAMNELKNLGAFRRVFGAAVVANISLGKSISFVYVN